MTDQKIEIITFHGWAFSPQIWQEWVLHLPKEIHWKHTNRGYFGNRADPVFSTGAQKKILIAHSFGLHLCPVGLIREADHLIILSSFLTFHPEHSSGSKKSKLLLRKMMSRFIEMPYEVLEDFYKKVYTPDDFKSELPDELNHDLLLHDLERLGESVIPPDLLHQIPAMTIVHGSKDKIVSNRKGRELYSLFSRRSQYFEIKNSGHAAGLTHANKCAKFMTPALQPSELEDRI